MSTTKVYEDFTGGLWEKNNDREVPENGLLECLNAYPLPTGGLRAAWNWTNHTPTNLPAAGSNQIFHGFHLFDVDSVDFDVFAAFGLDQEATHDINVKVIQAAASAASLNGTFAAVRTHTDQRRHVVDFALMVTTADFLRKCYYAMRFAAAGQRGIWQYDSAGPSSTNVYDDNVQNVFAHQDRLCAVERVTRPRVRFSDAGAASGWSGANNYFEAAPSIGSDLSFTYPIFPGDLGCMKQGHGLVVVQNDVADPLIKELPGLPPPQAVTRPVATHQGLIYMTRSDGVYLWNGDKPDWLSKQFQGTPMTDVVWSQAAGVACDFIGGVGYGNRFVVTPKGYCYDMRTGAWFKVEWPTATMIAPFLEWDFIRSRMIVAGHDGTAGSYSPKMLSAVLDEETMSRRVSYSFTLPPISIPDRRCEIRDVEVHLHNFQSGSDFTVTATNDAGVASTATATAMTNTGAQVVRVPIGGDSHPAVGDTIKVRFVVRSNHATAEAPAVRQIKLDIHEKNRYDV